MRPAILLCAVLAAVPAYSDDSSGEFLRHWATARQMALAVAGAMPAAGYGFTPAGEETSFGELMEQIAGGNYGYCASLGGPKPAFTKPDQADKETMMKLLAQSFDYCVSAYTWRPQGEAGKRDPDLNALQPGPTPLQEAMTRLEASSKEIEAFITDGAPKGAPTANATRQPQDGPPITMLAACAHLAHRLGQAEVYLRLKGLVPPVYVF